MGKAEDVSCDKIPEKPTLRRIRMPSLDLPFNGQRCATYTARPDVRHRRRPKIPERQEKVPCHELDEDFNKLLRQHVFLLSLRRPLFGNVNLVENSET